ncbi:UreD-domain-containing protein [Testicularia cyperi]|uniref:UreD-domain-containing protein n=1 Tax=Testicularia cyperi TaxID=1882483 RepID=A0A317XS95_9BASI|nr:UreD-domain-containing protein [Testicularia cyperi]
MPQETLTFPPIYCIVGAYRLAHDPVLWKPMWAKCSKAAKQAGILGIVWLVITWPIQKLFVHYFMSASASVTGMSGIYHTVVETADFTDDHLPFRIPVPSLQTFATLTFVLGQVHAIMEFWLRRKLRECRNTAYISTVRSRGKSADWWTEYVEEFSNPPTEKAIKDAKKNGFYLKLASPLVRFVILKVFLLPMDFVPLFGMALGAALRSLSYGRQLHKSFFEAKRMSPFQIELWITERQFQYRSFGFVAALMERMPLIGLVFSISNQIGAAMWAHDLEKRQQKVRAGGDDTIKDEFKSKPTLKKLYKEAQKIDSSANEPADLAHEANQVAPLRTDHFAGEGLAVLRSHSHSRSEPFSSSLSPSRDSSLRAAVFTHLSFTFPLKLISPGASSRNASRVVQTSSRASSSSSISKVVEGRAVYEVASGQQEVQNGTQQEQHPDDEENEAKAVAVMYIVGYGGGLVSGDKVDLDVDVGHNCTLLILTQGSTKVFKMRTTRPTTTVSTATSYDSTGAVGRGGGVPGSLSASALGALPSPTGAHLTTQQNYRFLVRPNATLVLLPDPVTCFAASRYDQVQRFDLRCRATSSLVVLDWITPGRTAVRNSASSSKHSSSKPDPMQLDPDQNSITQEQAQQQSQDSTPQTSKTRSYATADRSAEIWTFETYRSRNEVRIEGEVVARDILMLDQDLVGDIRRVCRRSGSGIGHIAPELQSELARRNSPYACYATLMLAGPDARSTIYALADEFEAIQQRPGSASLDVVWSFSLLERDSLPRNTRASQSGSEDNKNNHDDHKVRQDPGLTIVRIAATSSETLKLWLRPRLAALKSTVGSDLFKQALG